MEGLVPLDVVIHILNLVVLIVILRLLVYKPVKKFMDARTARLEEEKQKAAEERAALAAQKASYDDLLSHAQEEKAKVLSLAGEEAARKKEALLADARREVDQILSDARLAAEEEKQNARAAMQKESVALAGELAKKIIGREVTAADNEAVAERFFREMEHHD